TSRVAPVPRWSTARGRRARAGWGRTAGAEGVARWSSCHPGSSVAFGHVFPCGRGRDRAFRVRGGPPLRLAGRADGRRVRGLVGGGGRRRDPPAGVDTPAPAPRQ